jgi:1,4-dihydroxy-2-naphthoate octaprenyltransferase
LESAGYSVPDRRTGFLAAGVRKAWYLLRELRAEFLPASLVPVLVGASFALNRTGRWHAALFLWTLAGVGLVHLGANVLNDYCDHLSGNDARNRNFVRPFTGGSRLIQRGLLRPPEVLTLAVLLLALGTGAGLVIARRTGMPALALGVVGVAGGVAYSAAPFRLASRGLGELVIAVLFGVLPVVGAAYVQTRRISGEAAVVSLPIAVLIVAVLFVNQFQDMEADAAVGKRHWVVRLGRQRAARVYAVLMTVWVAILGLEVWSGILPRAAAWVLPVGLAGVPAVRVVLARHDRPRDIAPANALTVAIHLVAGLGLSAALLADAWGG